MKKISKLFIVLALVVNQMLMPATAWAQSITDTPTTTAVTPADTSAPAPTTNPTSAPTEAPTSTVAPLSPTSTPIDTVAPTTIAPTDTGAPTITTAEPTETTTPTASPTAIPTDGMSVQPATASANPATIVVVVDQATPTPTYAVNNSANINNSGSSSSNTGSNSISNGGATATSTPTPALVMVKQNSTITSGNAVAMANLVNIANTTSVGSNIKVYIVNNANGEATPIDLNTAWNILGSNSGVNMLTVDTSGNNIVSINNYGSIDNNVAAVATTGNNSITGGNGNISTGDAYALASVFNLLNLNALNSKIYLGIINVNGSSLGDLILPNPSSFYNSESGSVSGDVVNTANISSAVAANASTGNNSIDSGSGGTNTITTGNAIAWAQDLTMTNVTLAGSSNLILELNTLGNWTGKIYNWGTPGSVADGTANNLFMVGSDNGSGTTDNLPVNINNTASINNYVLASALTGGNSISGGNGSITTGTAYAGANATSLANINLFNSKFLE